MHAAEGREATHTCRNLRAPESSRRRRRRSDRLFCLSLRCLSQSQGEVRIWTGTHLPVDSPVQEQHGLFRLQHVLHLFAHKKSLYGVTLNALYWLFLHWGGFTCFVAASSAWFGLIRSSFCFFLCRFLPVFVCWWICFALWKCVRRENKRQVCFHITSSSVSFIFWIKRFFFFKKKRGRLQHFARGGFRSVNIWVTNLRLFSDSLHHSCHFNAFIIPLTHFCLVAPALTCFQTVIAALFFNDDWCQKRLNRLIIVVHYGG